MMQVTISDVTIDYIWDCMAGDGIGLEQINTITIVMNILGSVTELSFQSSGTYDLARGTGMLNQACDTDFGAGSLELVLYYIP